MSKVDAPAKRHLRVVHRPKDAHSTPRAKAGVHEDQRTFYDFIEDEAPKLERLQEQLHHALHGPQMSYDDFCVDQMKRIRAQMTKIQLAFCDHLRIVQPAGKSASDTRSTSRARQKTGGK